MILNIGPLGKSREKSPPRFTVTDGTYSYAQTERADGIVDWEIALLTGADATLTFGRVVDYVDVFLVGGGKPGGSRGTDSGGTGGKGGQLVTKSGADKISVTAGTSYTFTIGGSNEDTSIFGFTASSGGGSNGGTGGDISESRQATAGRDGAYAFGAGESLINSGQKYGAGGGGGGYWQGNVHINGKAGGATGGGHGADPNHTTKASASGAANTGSGGGGAGANISSSPAKYYSAGDGGSGIIIIRNHREE